MFRNLPELQVLNVTRCKVITDSVINALFCPTNLPLAPLPPPAKIPLQSLLLKNCTRITQSTILDIGKHGNLRHLDLSGCSKLTDEDLLPLASCDKMNTLLLESCYKVSSKISLFRIVIIIHFERNKVTDRFILQVVKNMTTLQKLSLKVFIVYCYSCCLPLLIVIIDVQEYHR